MKKTLFFVFVAFLACFSPALGDSCQGVRVVIDRKLTLEKRVGSYSLHKGGKILHQGAYYGDEPTLREIQGKCFVYDSFPGGDAAFTERGQQYAAFRIVEGETVRHICTVRHPFNIDWQKGILTGTIFQGLKWVSNMGVELVPQVVAAPQPIPAQQPAPQKTSSTLFRVIFWSCLVVGAAVIIFFFYWLLTFPIRRRKRSRKPRP